MILENKKTDDSCQVIDFKKEGNELKIIWVADMHNDSKKSRLNFLKKIVKKYPKAYLIFGGDSFDVMQNFADPRAAKSALKDSLKRDDYINAVIEESCDFYKPFKDKILAFNLGNHEEVQIRRHGIDMIKMMVDRLNETTKHEIICGDLAGWIKIRHSRGNGKATKNIYFSHQPISGGTRSKGVLSVDLLIGRYPDADIWICEHIHTSWILPLKIERFVDNGSVKYQNKWYIQAPTLKEEFSGKKRGYVHAKTYPATPIGVVILDFEISRTGMECMMPKYELL